MHKGTTWWRRARADRWAVLFGEIALYTFVVLGITGVYLAVFYDPAMTHVSYHGSYGPLRGEPVSRAYASVMQLSFDVRGGLLMRQIHHWAALIFVAAVCLLLLRLFVTGAFRRPRGLTWLTWVGLLVLGMLAGWTGTILPDDMLSGGSLALLQGVVESIPLAGGHLALWIFGGAVPGHQIIARLYWLHVAILPAAIAGVLAFGYWQVRRHGHASMPGVAGRGPRPEPRRSEPPRGALPRGEPPRTVPPRTVPPRTVPLRRVLSRAVAAAALARFFVTCGALALLGTLAQINPVWLLGPYRPGATSAGAVPDWYMGFLDGGLRIMPGWQVGVAGHPLVLGVLIPALIVPGAFFTILAAWPLIERWLTGDRSLHHVLDRPREAATRTAVGAAGITLYGLLWAAAANDQIAVRFHLSLFAVTWFFRIAVLAGPLLVYTVTQRICLGLTRRERDEAEHGRPTGQIVMSPDGGYREITEPARHALPAGRD